jgi:hypothetical protein
VAEFESEDLVFVVATPLRFTVRVTQAIWDMIVSVKHPAMAGKESDVRRTLEEPEEIRLSKRDQNVYLFYKSQRVGRWVCAVAKNQDDNGFLITAYPTDAIKEGVRIWPK